MGRPRKPLSPVDQVKPSKIVFASKAMTTYLYKQYGHHCDACIKNKITPISFDDWAIDYLKDGLLKHYRRAWTAETIREGIGFEYYDQYRAGKEAA